MPSAQGNKVTILDIDRDMHRAFAPFEIQSPVVTLPSLFFLMSWKTLSVLKVSCASAFSGIVYMAFDCFICTRVSRAFTVTRVAFWAIFSSSLCRECTGSGAITCEGCGARTMLILTFLTGSPKISSCMSLACTAGVEGGGDGWGIVDSARARCRSTSMASSSATEPSRRVLAAGIPLLPAPCCCEMESLYVKILCPHEDSLDESLALME